MDSSNAMHDWPAIRFFYFYLVHVDVSFDFMVLILPVELYLHIFILLDKAPQVFGNKHFLPLGF